MRISSTLRFFSGILLAFLILSGNLLAKKPPRHQQMEIIPQETEDSYRLPDMRVSKETATPLAIYRINYPVAPAQPEAMAREYLRDHAGQLRMNPTLEDLTLSAVRETPGGVRVRFRQTVAGYPVYGPDIAVSLDNHQQVVFLVNGYKTRAVLEDATVRVSEKTALDKARDYLGLSVEPRFTKTETVVYYNNGVTRLAHQITLIPYSEEMLGNWEILVDAQTGEIFRVQDQACYQDHGDNPSVVDGSGFVFDPDPLTHARAFYQAGGQFGDNNDNVTDSLTAHTVQRVLRDITESGGQFHLDGLYCNIEDFEAPFEGQFSQSTNQWHFNRNQQGFEAANVYYHIDASMRFINETLLFPLMPFQYSGGVRCDPHGLNGDDNSHYLPGTGQVSWGEGGVDDSEDADVILHELGHGLHDWVTNGQLSQVNGLSEGSGDFWANAYNRNTGFWTPADPQYYWMFQWDGHNEYWSGRITNYSATYPNGLTGSIHTDGQIWATALMQIWDDIGNDATCLNFLEGLSMTNGSTNQEDAAQAFIQADVNNFGGINLVAIEARFTARGYNVTIPLALPTTPANLSAYSDYQTPDGMAITWDDPTEYNTGDPMPAADFEIKIERNGSLIATVPGGTGTFTDAGLSDGQLYQYEIYAQVLATGTVSTVISTSWYAGGSPVPATPENFSISGNDAAITVSWNNASANEDGTPMDDLAGVNLYQNGNLVATYTQAAADTGAAQSEVFTLPVSGYYNWSIATVDNEGAGNISAPTAELGTPLGLPIVEAFEVAGEPNPGVWINDNAEVNDRANNPPSGTLALNLNGSPNGGDRVEMRAIDLSGVDPNSIYFEFSWQPQGNGNAPEPNDSLWLYFKNDSGDWIEVWSVGGSTLLPFQTETIEINLAPNGGGSYFHGQFQVRFVSSGGAGSFPNDDWFVDDVTLNTVVGVNDRVIIPLEFALDQNYPNPFNPSTTVRYSLAAQSEVSLVIYDVLGRRIRSLVNATQQAGFREVVWDGRNDSGVQVASGIYLYRLEAGDLVATRKLMLMK